MDELVVDGLVVEEFVVEEKVSSSGSIRPATERSLNRPLNRRLGCDPNVFINSMDKILLQTILD